MRWLRTPLLHLVAGSALLFCSTRVVGPRVDLPPVVITAADVAHTRSACTVEESGHNPPPPVPV